MSIQAVKINKTFTDDFYFDDQSEHMSNSYYILNASMEIKIKHFNISLWSKNIDDIKYPIRGYKFALDPTFIEKEYVSYGDRKNSGITMSYIFKN